MGQQKIICVDLDGTLIKSDMLFETLCHALKRDPKRFLLAPFWLLRGRAHLKERLARGVTVNPSSLPFNAAALQWLRAQHEAGHRLILATASDLAVAKPIADHVGIFDEVIASNGAVNLKAGNKLKELNRRFGEKGFTYVGDSRADKVVWSGVDERVAVTSDRAFARHLETRFPGIQIIGEPKGRVKVLLKAIRVHQWVKNLLIFLPLVMAHEMGGVLESGMPRLLAVVLAFASFCLCASSVYVLNDILDLDADRAHATKRQRPFAAGDLPLSTGLMLVPALLAGSLGLAALLPLPFLGMLALYFALTTSYSFYLKQVVLLDVIVLASLYSLRVLAGGVAADVKVSQWLVAFSMFIFFSLACVKRFSELLNLRRLNERATKGRGYVASDLEQIAQFGASSGYISILVLALYVSSEEVMVLYGQPKFLWLICPILFYWLSRVWLLAQRGILHEDPIVFAIHDRVSYFTGLLCVLIVLLAVSL